MQFSSQGQIFSEFGTLLSSRCRSRGICLKHAVAGRATSKLGRFLSAILHMAVGELGILWDPGAPQSTRILHMPPLRHAFV